MGQADAPEELSHELSEVYPFFGNEIKRQLTPIPTIYISMTRTKHWIKPYTIDIQRQPPPWAASWRAPCSGTTGEP